MAVLFRPTYPVDQKHWLPLMKEKFKAYDFRIWPDVGNTDDIDYLIAWKVFDGEATAYPNLKAVLSLSAGVNQYMNNPDFPKGAKLIRMIEPGLTQGMCEYVLHYVMHCHQEHSALDLQNPDSWGGIVPKLAGEKTVGILGLGHLGKACAHTLVKNGFAVRGWSRSPKEISGIKSFVGQDAFKDFLSGSDILVCLLPLTAETEDILNKETLSYLPSGASIINAARGPLIVDEDLITALDNGHLACAVLDVFRKEPLPESHPFWTHPKIVITPHIAAITMPETGIIKILENIEKLEKGEAPDGQVDLNRAY